MKKLSAWYFDGPGPSPDSLGFTALSLVGESEDLVLEKQVAAVTAAAAALPAGGMLVVNAERYKDGNIAAAVACLEAAHKANPAGLYSAYVPQLGGERWGICGKQSDPAVNARAVAAVLAVAEKLAPFVDFWCVDMFRANSTIDANTDAPMQFYNTTPDATWEIVAATRVALLARFAKPWVGMIGVKSIPGTAKQRADELDAQVVLHDARWCEGKGAAGVCVMVWDDAKKNAEGAGGTGTVAVTANINKALALVGRL